MTGVAVNERLGDAAALRLSACPDACESLGRPPIRSLTAHRVAVVERRPFVAEAAGDGHARARRRRTGAVPAGKYDGHPVTAPFVHLHVHSEYSILDGACRIPALAAKAAALDMPAVSLTDHGSLAGTIELVKAAAKEGVKPIIGCEVYVVDERRRQEKGHAHLTLLASDNEGYANLIKLSSLAYLEGYYYRPRTDWELLERHAKGLIALSGCLSGRVSRALVESRERDAELELDRLEQIYGRDNVYVELQNAGLEVQQQLVAQLAALAGKRSLPLVATGDVHYLDAGRRCLARGLALHPVG